MGVNFSKGKVVVILVSVDFYTLKVLALLKSYIQCWGHCSVSRVFATQAGPEFNPHVVAICVCNIRTGEAEMGIFGASFWPTQ